VNILKTVIHRWREEMMAAVSEKSTRRRDDDEVARFVERFAAVLADAGVPRMAARVFACLFVTDSGSLTAAELAARLKVSPAAVSGAVRYLAPLNLVSREREPGSRRDLYRVHDDVWYEVSLERDQILARWKNAARDGADLLGRDTPAGARLAESVTFFEFLIDQMGSMPERWRAYQAQMRERQAAADRE
jgi:DNA-binding transcriptional ArsR family regulator